MLYMCVYMYNVYISLSIYDRCAEVLRKVKRRGGPDHYLLRLRLK